MNRIMKKYIPLSLLFCLFTFNAHSQSKLTLQECTSLAIENNAKLRTSRNNVLMSNETRKEAFTKYFPQLSAMGFGFIADKSLLNIELDQQFLGSIIGEAAAGLPSSVGALKNGMAASVSAVQPVFVGGQIVNGNKLAKLGEEVSQIQLQQSENEVILQTSKFYWNIVQLKENLRTIDAVDAQLASIMKDVKAAVDAGISTRNDMLKVQLKQNEMTSSRLQINNGIGILKLLLAQYIGMGCEPVDVNLTSLQVPENMYTDLVTQEGIERNTNEYMLLQKNVEAQKLQKKLALGKMLPTVSIGGAFASENLSSMPLGNNGRDMKNHMIGMATVSIPISDWWGGSHSVKKQKIAVENARIQLEDNAVLLKVNIINKRNSVEEIINQINVSQNSIAQAQENLRLQRDYYNAGTCTMSDLLEAQTLLQKSNDKLTDNITQYHIRLLEYNQACGR